MTGDLLSSDRWSAPCLCSICSNLTAKFCFYFALNLSKLISFCSLCYWKSNISNIIHILKNCLARNSAILLLHLVLFSIKLIEFLQSFHNQLAELHISASDMLVTKFGKPLFPRCYVKERKLLKADPTSSRWQFFFGTSVLKSLAKLTGKHLEWSLL